MNEWSGIAGKVGMGWLSGQGGWWGYLVINLYKECSIKRNLTVGFIFFLVLNGCASLKDSLILGAGSGAVFGGVIGNQNSNDRSEGTIKGAVIGGVVGGLASYLIHGSLEKRDASMRRETLMNLERYEVLGMDGLAAPQRSERTNGKCFTTREVDGRFVSIPCSLVNDSSYEGEK